LISVRSEVQILPGPPPTERCGASFGRSATAALLRRESAEERSAPCVWCLFCAARLSRVAAQPLAARRNTRRNKSCVGGVAQLGERLLCKQEVIGSIPFTSTTDRTMRSIVRVATERCAASLVSRRDRCKACCAESGPVQAKAPLSGRCGDRGARAPLARPERRDAWFSR
jgi:hypothetical protein